MSMISRHWRCNACAKGFHSYDVNPECPHCGCVRVSWMPAAVNIGKHAAVDRQVRSLAENYGMSDIADVSPSRNDRAMPKVVQSPPADGPVREFAPGFSARIGRDPTCGPSLSRIPGGSPTPSTYRAVIQPEARIHAGTREAAAAIRRGGKEPAS